MLCWVEWQFPCSFILNPLVLWILPPFVIPGLYLFFMFSIFWQGRGLMNKRQGFPTSPSLPRLRGWNSGSAVPQLHTLGWGVFGVGNIRQRSSAAEWVKKRKAGGARGWGEGEEHIQGEGGLLRAVNNVPVLSQRLLTFWQPPANSILLSQSGRTMCPGRALNKALPPTVFPFSNSLGTIFLLIVWNCDSYSQKAEQEKGTGAKSESQSAPLLSSVFCLPPCARPPPSLFFSLSPSPLAPLLSSNLFLWVGRKRWKKGVRVVE